MPTHHLKLFGSSELNGGDDILSQPKRLAVLTFLTVARPYGFHRRDSLVARFWPEFDKEHARAALRKSIHALRKCLGDDLIVVRGDDELRINRTHLSCDVVDFDEAIKTNALTTALELYRGDILPGFYSDSAQFDVWLDLERARCREAATDAAWQLATRYEAEQEITLAGRVARNVVRLATTDERMLRRVIQMLERAGDHAGAAQAYKEFVARLKNELDIEPSPETKALMSRIRGQ